jgi:hypothetical protein
MNAPNDNTAAKGLRGWWLSPPRPGMQRLIRVVSGRCCCGRAAGAWVC